MCECMCACGVCGAFCCACTGVCMCAEKRRRHTHTHSCSCSLPPPSPFSLSVFELRQVHAKISAGGIIRLLIECTAIAKLQEHQTVLFKVKEGHSMPRHYWINESATRIFWKSRTKKARTANIRAGDIKEVRSVSVSASSVQPTRRGGREGGRERERQKGQGFDLSGGVNLLRLHLLIAFLCACPCPLRTTHTHTRLHPFPA